MYSFQPFSVRMNIYKNLASTDGHAMFFPAFCQWCDNGKRKKEKEKGKGKKICIIVLFVRQLPIELCRCVAHEEGFTTSCLPHHTLLLLMGSHVFIVSV